MILRLQTTTEVPAFHPFASENQAMTWNFMVHDFGDDARRRLPEHEPPSGVLYPRASALGGCTAHNAMIFMAPHDSDWDEIAELTGDSSWSARHMRRYLHRLEDCRHRPLWRFLSRLTGDRFNPTGHGWKGWLETEIAMPRKAFGDLALMRVMRGAIRADLRPTEAGGLAAWLRSVRQICARPARVSSSARKRPQRSAFARTARRGSLPAKFRYRHVRGGGAGARERVLSCHA